jgi:hypothetical protein
MADWQSFYVIVGSSGAALIGLQFVVMTLIAAIRMRASADTLGAFGTPNVVHFAGALFISAIMSAPWRSVESASVVLLVFGLSGLAYGVLVIRRARQQTLYKPVWEDWLWYAALPCGVYVAVAAGALFLRTADGRAMFVIAAAALGLLFIGIHNAWDTVTHIVVTGSHDDHPDH